MMFRYSADRSTLHRTRVLGTEIPGVVGREFVDVRRSGQCRNPGSLVTGRRGQRRGAEAVAKHCEARAVRNDRHVGPRNVGVTLVIDPHQLDPMTVNSAASVGLVDIQLHGFDSLESRRTGRTTQRIVGGNADGRTVGRELVTKPDNDDCAQQPKGGPPGRAYTWRSDRRFLHQFIWRLSHRRRPCRTIALSPVLPETEFAVTRRRPRGPQGSCPHSCAPRAGT